MANIKSSKKDIERIKRNTQRNVSVRSKVKTFFKKALAAISSGDKAQASQAFISAQSEAAKAVSKGVLRANTVSRMTKSLNAKLKLVK